MAAAFKTAIEAGRGADLAGLGRVREKGGEASSPLTRFLREDGRNNNMSDKINEIVTDEIRSVPKENRIDHMTYLPGMEIIESDIHKKVIGATNAYDYNSYH